MSQASFEYSTSGSDTTDGAGLPLTLSIFANRTHVRDQMREDAAATGFRIAETGDVASLLDGEARALGEVVLLDCPQVDGAELAALSRLDERAFHAGLHLIVSTSVDALDDVFACLGRSEPQILVNPTRAERVIAIGRALAKGPGNKVRELSEADRLMLIRLTEQVGQIAGQLESLGGPALGQCSSQAGFSRPGGSAFRFEAPNSSYSAETPNNEGGLLRKGKPALPEARLVRRIIRQRQQRARFFDADLFADPAWDMLLDLTAARVEGTRVAVTSLCIASGVPPTTALRWIGQMTEAGWFQRVDDNSDRRRAFIGLTDKAVDAMARYFAEVGETARIMA